jgi:peptide/nickel transport system permease protein
MGGYLAGRLVHALFVMIGASLLVFLILWAAGDPARVMMPPDATREEIDRFRQANGWDRPLAIQYVDFLANALRGDFGTSFRHKVAALPLVLERVPATLQLVGASTLFAVILALPLGILSATRRDGWIDTLSSVMALFFQAAPTFWLGIMLIILFSETLKWLPAIGAGSWQQLVMPSIALGSFTLAIMTRLLRSSLIEVLSSDYVRTARAKGLVEQVVIVGHAMRNALIPVVTVLGLQIGVLLGGTVITEQVFAYPGMGLLILQSINNRDIPVVQTAVVLIAGVIVLINLAVDLLYTVLDPRIRLG